MKTLSTFILSLLLGATVKVNAQQFTLSGKITGEPNATLFLKYIDSKENPVTDSCSLRDGAFSFKLNIKEPTKIYLTAFIGRFRWRDDSDPNSANLFMDPADMVVTGMYNHLHDLEVTGSKSNDEFKAYDINLSLSQKNTNSVITAFGIDAWKSRLPLDSVEHLYDRLSPAIKATRYAKELEAFIIAKESNSANKPAKNFTASDMNGKTISLSDFKGKYVLLDFWGSWCVPCRAAVPHLKDLYAKYHNSGLEVIAISVEDKKDNWLQAIKKDGTGQWHNIMEPNDNDNPGVDKNKLIDDLYTVRIFPTKILIDTKGMIIDRYDGTEKTTALDKKLAEVFDAKK